MRSLIDNPLVSLVGMLKLVAHGRTMRTRDRINTNRLLTADNARMLLAIGDNPTTMKGSSDEQPHEHPVGG